MTRYCLQRLSIEGFRGINNVGSPLTLKLDPSKVTSVFGENGMGKSSIFEALEYAIFGRINRLEDLQQVESADRYYVNQFHPGPARIVLDFVPNDGGPTVTITVERAKNGKRKVTAVNTPDGDAFLRDIQAETLLMDYQTFNRFILESPLNRGRFLARLLGMEKVSAARATLNSLSDVRNLNTDLEINALQAKLKAAQSGQQLAMSTALNQLSDITSHSISLDSFDYRQVAMLCLGVLNEDPVISPLIKEQKLSQIDFKNCLDKLIESDRSGERTKLAELQLIKGQLSTPVDLEGLEGKLDTLLALVRERQELVDKSKGEAFKVLYQAAQKVVETSSLLDECPLCEREWAHTSGLTLPQHVAVQLEGYREILDSDKVIKDHWKLLVQDTAIAKLSVELAKCVPEAAPTAFGEVDVPTDEQISTLRDSFWRVEQSRRQVLADIESKVSAIEALLPPSVAESIRAVTAAKNLTATLRAYADAQKEAKETSGDLSAISQWQAFISQAAATFAQEEATLVQTTIELLEKDIQTLYSAIMPGAPVLPKLNRQAGTERLLLMLEQFHGVQDAHAVPLLSESYRNALGLAVFLAASQKRSHGGSFLVLDDVTSSFDAGHQAYLLEAIYNHVATPENPNGLQVIILSHDGILRKYFDFATNSGKAWINHKLQGNAPTGMVSTMVVPPDQLRSSVINALNVGDLDAARRAVRPYLEASLLQVIEKVNIKVPIDMAMSDQKKMIGDMMTAIKSEITLRQQANQLILNSADVRVITQNIIPFLQVNAWAHYATDSGASVGAQVIRGVADAIEQLVDAFRYTCNCKPATPQRKFLRTLGDKQKGCGINCA